MGAEARGAGLVRFAASGRVWDGAHLLRSVRAAPAGGARLDYRGALLVTAAIASLIFGLSYGQQHSFTGPATIAALIATVVLGAAFVRVELTAQAPMLPLAISQVTLAECQLRKC